MIQKKINDLQTLASSKNLTVKFRNRKTNCGDFCIFIYGPTQKRYLVGFDGYYNTDYKFTFEYCYEQAKKYINEFEQKRA